MIHTIRITILHGILYTDIQYTNRKGSQGGFPLDYPALVF